MKFENGERLAMITADGAKILGQVVRVVKRPNGAVKEYDVKLSTGTTVCYTPKQLNVLVEFSW